MMDMQIEGHGNGGTHQPSCSDSEHILAIRKILEDEFEPMVLKIFQRLVKPIVITTVQQEIVPVAEDLFRRVVKDEIQPLKEQLLTRGTRNDFPKERTLELRFSDKVSDTVQTSTELKSIDNECLKLALVDSTGKTVICGSESSAKVEIVLLEDNGDNDENNGVTRENFQSRIISAGDKERPHFAKSVYRNLKEGVADLTDLKLGQDKDWTKLCSCRLGARVAQNLEGIVVQEAWTAPFKVIDKRGKQYEKHYPPSLDSEVWRLDRIARKGEPCKRLKGENIKNLADFLFWFYVNPKRLQQILLPVVDGDSKWKTITTHAQTCIIKDKRMFSQKSPNKPHMVVVYDVVGKLEGVIKESHFVRIDNLSTDEKDHAYKLLSSVLEGSAFGERYNTPFDVEASLPHRSSHERDAHCLSGTGSTLSGNIYQTTERGSSSQSIVPNNACDSGPPSHSLGSKEVGELCNPTDLGTLDHEKHETPSLFDEVSRLVNICKDGEIHRRLQVNKINTVEEFLIQLLIDQEEIRQIVSLEREEWEATVSNATRACSTGNGRYCYTSLKLMKGVVFNLLGDVLGLLSFDKYFYPTSTLSEHDKGEARELVASARRNWRDVERYNEPDHLREPSIASGSNSLPWNEPINEGESWRDFLCPSPNPMFEYCNWSCNTQTAVDPKRWKKFSRLWFLLKEWMPIDVTCKNKKRKLC